jgi:long-subunit acyl-CoA synthetase (AMP-forming)
MLECNALPDDTAHILIVLVPQVAMVYFKDPENTAKAMDNFGWFDTGNVGRINPAKGYLIVTGQESRQGYY